MKRRGTSRISGIVQLRRLAPVLQRDLRTYEYIEPYRLGTVRIWHIPGITRSWVRGRWDERTAKNPDDHEDIQQHLLGALQVRARGYFAGDGNMIDPAGQEHLVR